MLYQIMTKYIRPKADKVKFTEKINLFLEESGFVTFTNRGEKNIMINKAEYRLYVGIYNTHCCVDISSTTKFIRFQLAFDYHRMMEPLMILLNNINFIASEIWKDFSDHSYISFSANEYFVFCGINKYDIIKMLES
jgi:hypothetical protein